ncbi:MAG TPA: hypothetical protein DEF47_08290 [Herpetosiphon sp.]|uniref:hypothetical protein n=1 Tax=Herpetosiphon sp. TaxID=71864 RepID=UPI00059E8D5F|nr:hypothetical protein [Herpetosiphon sp.]HBW49892.1 hypothetical protein [Herpetosiphon sp.]
MTVLSNHDEQSALLAHLLEHNPVGTAELSDDDLELCIGGTAYAGKRSPGCVTMVGGECCEIQLDTK